MAETKANEGTVRYINYVPLPKETLTGTDLRILEALKEEWRLKIAPTFGWDPDIMEFTKKDPNFAKAVAQSRITREPVFASIKTKFGNFRLPEGYFEFRVSHNVRVDGNGRLHNADKPKVNFNIYPVAAEWKYNKSREPEIQRIVLAPLNEESILKYGNKTLIGEIKKQIVLNGRYEGPVDPVTLEPVSRKRISELLYDMNLELSGSQEKTEAAHKEFESLLVLSSSRYSPTNIFGVNLSTRAKQISVVAPKEMGEETLMELTMGYPVHGRDGYTMYFDNQLCTIIEAPSYAQVKKERFDAAAKEAMAASEAEAKAKANKQGNSLAPTPSK